MARNPLAKFEKRYSARDFIVREGEPGNEFFIVKSGECLIFRTTAKRRIAELGRLNPGDFFGETALFEERTRAASVQALTDATLIVLDKRALRDLMKNSPTFALKIIDGLLKKVFAFNNKYLDSLPGYLS